MDDLIREIDQISIYLKKKEERENEVSFFAPFTAKEKRAALPSSCATRGWHYEQKLSFGKRWLFYLRAFIYGKVNALIPHERKTNEAKLKTVLAILLSQKELQEFFLNDPKRQYNFLSGVKKVAKQLEVTCFDHITIGKPKQMEDLFTRLAGARTSLLEDPLELKLQIASMHRKERNEILFQLLSLIERPPIHSVIEVIGKQEHSIATETKFAKIQVVSIDKRNGSLAFTFEENRATSSIQTTENTKIGKKSAMNQRIAFDADGNSLGSYCGVLTSENNVLEQLLFLLDLKQSVSLQEESEVAGSKKMTLLFTALFSWNEAEWIFKEYHAIEALNGKVLSGLDSKGQMRSYELNLLFFNLPLNAYTKFPAPKEMMAHIQDACDETLIALTSLSFEKLQEIGEVKELEPHRAAIYEIATKMRHLRDPNCVKQAQEKNESFINREKERLETIDAFRVLKKPLLESLLTIEKQDPFNFGLSFPDSEEIKPAVQVHIIVESLIALLSQKTRSKEALTKMDQLIYLDLLTKRLGLLHNKNCYSATDRSAAAIAADKAQNAFKHFCGHPFLPKCASQTKEELFKLFYSLYLVFEEPEITSGLSTGFIGEKYHRNFVQKNKETTHYLIDWIKQNPHIYLGLSNYRD